MRRRELLAGLGGAAIVGAGGYVVLSPAGSDDIAPVEVNLFDAPGSSGGTMTVPVDGQVTVIDLFATTCPPCKPALDELAAARPDAGDVQFISVTGEYIADGSGRSRTDVIEWWKTHGDRWPVGHDADNALLSRFGAGSLPFTVVVDPQGTVVWSHTGVPAADRITRAIEDARA